MGTKEATKRTVPRAPMAKITKIITTTRIMENRHRQNRITTKTKITTTTIRRIRAKTIENLEQRQVHRVLIVLLRGTRIMAIIITTTTTTTTIIIITIILHISHQQITIIITMEINGIITITTM